MEMLDIISDIAAWCLAGGGEGGGGGGFIALDAGALRQFVQRREVSLGSHLGRGRTAVNKNIQWWIQCTLAS